MTTFKRFLCWEPGTVEATIAQDVASAHEATLLATHQSLPLAECSPPLLEPGDRVSEQHVLTRFVEAATDPLVMGIVGPAGSGKSHLIRWMHGQLKGDDRYHVIYVPRQGTNLRSVLERILSRLPGPASQELLEQLEAATATVSPDEAAAVLFDQICNVIEFRPPPAADPERQLLRDELTGFHRTPRVPGLATVLRLPHFRERLLAPDGVIHAYVGQTFGDEPLGDGAPEFTPGDLRVPILRNLTELLPPEAHAIYAEVTSDSGWAAAAAQLLNDSLEDALGQVLGLQGGVPLADVMNRSRVLLAEQGLELVLLIEDFALLQNKIDRQLLDALLVPSMGAPDEPRRCPLRTAFAITDHPYLALPETLRTRIGLLYWTGLGVAEAGGMPAAFRFVASYLNAARVGSDALENAFSSAEAQVRPTKAWVPNKCDWCDLKAACHDDEEGFGALDGVGLYPYNRVALERVLSSVLREGHFDPRTIVKRAVGELLTRDAPALESGTFPSEQFRRRYPPAVDQRVLLAEVKEALGRYPEAHRREVLLEYWGGLPEEVVNLGQTIHDAFDLPPVTGARQAEPDVEPEPTEERALPGATQAPMRARPTATAADLEAIDHWLANEGRAIPQALASRLRNRLHELVFERIQWNDELISPRLPALEATGGEIFSPASFQIEGAPGQNPKETAVRFPLRRQAEDALILKAIVQLDQTGSFAFKGGGRHFLRLSVRLDEWTSRVVAAARSYGASPGGSPLLSAAIQCLVLTARIAAVPGSFSEDPLKVVRAALESVPVANQAVGSGQWRQLRSVASSPEREEVRNLAIALSQAAQGDGRILALDVAPMITIAEQFDATLTLDEVDRAAPRYLRQLRRQLHGGLSNALDREAERLLELAERLSAIELDGFADAISLVASVGRLAAERGMMLDYARFSRLCDKLEQLEFGAVKEYLSAAQLLTLPSSERLKAVVLSHDLASVVEEVVDMVAEIDYLLSQAIGRAESELSQRPDIDLAKRRAGEMLNSLAEVLENFEGSR